MTQCRHFSGYKPCSRSSQCDSKCAFLEPVEHSILIVHLGAIGAVVRSTSLLRAIKRKYPFSKITWVTQKPCDKLLLGHPLVDQVLTTTDSDLLKIAPLEFDIAIIVDKSIEAAGVLSRTRAKKVFGFTCNVKNGAILPATPAANDLWELGLNNHKKFFVNTKPETQLMIEAFELGDFKRDEYFIHLTQAELDLANERRTLWLRNNLNTKVLIGINTGCSNVIEYKKLTVEYHRKLIQKLKQQFNCEIVLLGGPEDTERNVQIAQGLDVIQSPTNLGLRDGLASVQACDLVVTGDSLGMHMAIALKKWVVAWFGPTCAHEIDLYDRGELIRTQAACSPCWKRSCNQQSMCYDQVRLEDFINAVARGIEFCKKSFLSKQPFLEICS